MPSPSPVDLSTAVAIFMAQRYITLLGLLAQPVAVLVAQAVAYVVVVLAAAAVGARLQTAAQSNTAWRPLLLFLLSYVDMGVGILNMVLVATLATVSIHYTGADLPGLMLTVVLASLVSALSYADCAVYKGTRLPSASL